MQEGYGHGYGVAPQERWAVHEVTETVMVPQTQMVAQTVMVPREVRRIVQAPVVQMVPPPPQPYHELLPPLSRDVRAPDLLARDEPTITPKAQRVQRAVPPPPAEEVVVAATKKTAARAARSAPAPSAGTERVVEREVQVERIVEKLVEVHVEVEKVR